MEDTGWVLGQCEDFIPTDARTQLSVIARWIRSWAACLFDAIHNCPFLDEQYRRLVAPTRKVDMVISMCRITIDLRTAQFYIGNESQPLFQLVMGSGQKRVGHTRNHNRNIFRVLK